MTRVAIDPSIIADTKKAIEHVVSYNDLPHKVFVLTEVTMEDDIIDWTDKHHDMDGAVTRRHIAPYIDNCRLRLRTELRSTNKQLLMLFKLAFGGM